MLIHLCCGRYQSSQWQLPKRQRWLAEMAVLDWTVYNSASAWALAPANKSLSGCCASNTAPPQHWPLQPLHRATSMWQCGSVHSLQARLSSAMRIAAELRGMALWRRRWRRRTRTRICIITAMVINQISHSFFNTFFYCTLLYLAYCSLRLHTLLAPARWILMRDAGTQIKSQHRDKTITR